MVKPLQNFTGLNQSLSRVRCGNAEIEVSFRTFIAGVNHVTTFATAQSPFHPPCEPAPGRSCRCRCHLEDCQRAARASSRRRAVAGCRMNAARERKLIRILHLFLSIPILGFLYGPVSRIPPAAWFTRFVAMPLVILSGFWLWLKPRLLRWLKNRHTREVNSRGGAAAQW
jgi:hypothetical protein